MAGWMYILYAPPVSGTILCFMGWAMETEINANYSVDIRWYWWALGGGAIVAFMVYRGIEVSGMALMLFGAAEVLLVLLLASGGSSTQARAASRSRRSTRATRRA